MTTHRMQTTRWRSARWRSRASSAVAVDAKRLAKLEEACQSWKKAPPSEASRPKCSCWLQAIVFPSEEVFLHRYISAC